MDRDCDTGMCAASAKEKAIACLSMDVRPPCDSKGRSDGNAHAQRSALGNPTEFLAAVHRRAVVHSCRCALCYSGTTSAEPANSLGKFFNLVSPSRIGSTDVKWITYEVLAEGPLPHRSKDQAQ